MVEHLIIFVVSLLGPKQEFREMILLEDIWNFGLSRSIVTISTLKDFNKSWFKQRSIKISNFIYSKIIKKNSKYTLH